MCIGNKKSLLHDFKLLFYYVRFIVNVCLLIENSPGMSNLICDISKCIKSYFFEAPYKRITVHLIYSICQ